jgi:hypothetical protein
MTQSALLLVILVIMSAFTVTCPVAVSRSLGLLCNGPISMPDQDLPRACLVDTLRLVRVAPQLLCAWCSGIVDGDHLIVGVGTCMDDLPGKRLGTGPDTKLLLCSAGPQQQHDMANSNGTTQCLCQAPISTLIQRCQRYCSAGCNQLAWLTSSMCSCLPNSSAKAGTWGNVLIVPSARKVQHRLHAAPLASLADEKRLLGTVARTASTCHAGLAQGLTASLAAHEPPKQLKRDMAIGPSGGHMASSLQLSCSSSFIKCCSLQLSSLRLSSLRLSSLPAPHCSSFLKSSSSTKTYFQPSGSTQAVILVPMPGTGPGSLVIVPPAALICSAVLYTSLVLMATWGVQGWLMRCRWVGVGGGGIRGYEQWCGMHRWYNIVSTIP